LEKRLDDAIAKEDYEKAAQLRDELKKLQGRNS
jgi:protein-arginine kinase activator protein McsA